MNLRRHPTYQSWRRHLKLDLDLLHLFMVKNLKSDQRSHPLVALRFRQNFDATSMLEVVEHSLELGDGLFERAVEPYKQKPDEILGCALKIAHAVGPAQGFEDFFVTEGALMGGDRDGVGCTDEDACAGIYVGRRLFEQLFDGFEQYVEGDEAIRWGEEVLVDGLFDQRRQG